MLFWAWKTGNLAIKMQSNGDETDSKVWAHTVLEKEL